MKLNKKKSGIMFLENKIKNTINQKYRILDLNQIPVLNKYKYLGVWLDNCFNLNENTK